MDRKIVSLNWISSCCFCGREALNAEAVPRDIAEHLFERASINDVDSRFSSIGCAECRTLLQEPAYNESL